MLADMTHGHSHALANLATSTKSDRDTVANMSKTIADLTLQLGQANTKLVEAQSSTATLTSKLAKTGSKSNQSSTIPTTATSSSRYNARFLKDGYWWSHGFKVTHNSTNRENKKSSHMTSANRSDTMGRKMCNKGWDKRRDKCQRVCDKLDDK